MKRRKIYPLALLAFVMMFTACKDDTITPPDDTKKQEEVEGTFVGSWTSENADLPTQRLRDTYQKMILTLNDDDTYSWVYQKKTGEKTTFTGTWAILETEDKHTSGSSFYWMNIYVTHINGVEAPGGWQGIAAFENPTNLKVNVEPTVVGWSTWPDSEVGLGSGQSGMDSVFDFSK